MKKLKAILLILTSIILLSNCSKDGDINIMSVQDDKDMGEQLDAEILANPSEYPILDKEQNPEAYAMVEGVMLEVLKSEHILYRDEFDWQVRIINSDVYNAFAAPGGKLYFYTGLLKYMESEAELAGVMAHEIAHADLRHSSERITKVYGLQMALNIALGKDKTGATKLASDLATGATALKFSRNDEFEADAASVKYLADINTKNYYPIAITDFFDRIVADGYDKEDGNFAFTRTHPYNADRKTNVIKTWESLGSPEGEKFVNEYNTFKSIL
jgi:beta-barrel assembly-enhancing protease